MKTEACLAGGQHTVKDNQRWCDQCRPLAKERARQRVVKHRARKTPTANAREDRRTRAAGLTFEERLLVAKELERVSTWRAEYARLMVSTSAETSTRIKAGPVGQADAVLDTVEGVLRLLLRRHG